MVGIGTIICIAVIGARARLETVYNIILYTKHDIGILCVFHGSFGSRSLQQWRRSIVYILLLLLLYRTRTMMTVPSQLARARARRLIFNGKTRLLVAGFLIIFPTPPSPLSRTLSTRNHAYTMVFFL